jgi:2'-5' RNA ligase
MPKYNLAYVATDDPEQYIAIATNFSENVKEIDHYYLNKDKLPHVTIAQFEMDEKDLDDLCKKLSQLKLPSTLSLSYNDMQSSHHDALRWYSLMPNELKLLHDIHQKVLNVIAHPTNRHGDKYDPHLTLMNSRDITKPVAKINLPHPLSGQFTLMITDRDDVGQAMRVVRPSM